MNTAVLILLLSSPTPRKVLTLELNVSASVELTVELQVASFSGGCRYIKLYR